MAIKLPNSWDIKAISEEIGLDLEDEEILEYIELMGPAIESYNYIDKVPDNLPEVKYPRTPGYKPRGEENKYNAWHVKTTVKGSSRGKLVGKTVVLKDNVMSVSYTHLRAHETR